MFSKEIFLIGLALLAIRPQAAGWRQEYGLGGGSGYQVDFDGRTLYAATGDGIYATAPGGPDWRPVALAGKLLYGLAKTDSGFVAYGPAGSGGYALFISRDGGSGWTELVRPGTLRGLAAQGNRVQVVRKLPNGFDSLLTSRDGGATWNSLYAGYGLTCGWLGTAIACVQGGNMLVRKDTDSGWDTIGVAGTLVFSRGYAFGVTSGGGLAKYSAHGLDWSKSLAELGSPRSVEVLYGSDSLILLKTDSTMKAGRGSESPIWEGLQVQDPQAAVIDRMIWAAGRGFLSTKYSGVLALALSPGEARLEPFDAGLPAGARPILRAAGPRLYAADFAGLWSRTDNQESWSLSARIPDPHDLMWADADAVGMTRRGRLTVSLDGGVSFQAVAPALPGALRAVTRIGSLYLAAVDTVGPALPGESGPRGNIYQASALPGPWSYRGYRRGMAPTTLLAHAGDLFGLSSGHLIVSRDSGRTWPDTLLPGRIVKALAGDSSRVYAGTDSGRIFASGDDGRIWQALALAPAPDTLVDVLATGGGKAFLASRAKNGLAYVQAFSGAEGTWTGMENLMLPGPISSLAFFGGRLYAGTEGSGLLSYPTETTAVRALGPAARRWSDNRSLRLHGKGRGRDGASPDARRLDGKATSPRAEASQWEFSRP